MIWGVEIEYYRFRVFVGFYYRISFEFESVVVFLLK